MQTYILKDELHEARTFAKSRISETGTRYGDRLNTLLSGRVGNANMVSGVFAFENKPAIRYRRILTKGTDLANDTGFADLLYDWIMNGKGEAFVCFSKMKKANLREIQPYRIGNTFFFFNGRYGTGDMWSAVRDARRRGKDIPQVIHNTFCEVGTYTMGGQTETKEYTGTLEEWMNGGYDDRFPFANKVMYETPDEIALPRPYRIWVWEDGTTYYDEYFKTGYTSGLGRVYLDHIPVRYTKVEDEFEINEECDDGIARWRI